MQRNDGNVALGFVCGVGATLVLVVVIGLLSETESPLCDIGETAVSCARNWFNGVAILAGASTIFLLLREQALAREVAILQTLDVRARLVTNQRLARVFGILARRHRSIAQVWPRVDGDSSERHIATDALYNLLNTYDGLKKGDLRESLKVNAELAAERKKIEKVIVDIISCMVPEDDLDTILDRNFTSLGSYVVSDWSADIHSEEFDALADRLDIFATGIDSMSNKLLEFRGSQFFSNRDSISGR